MAKRQLASHSNLIHVYSVPFTRRSFDGTQVYYNSYVHCRSGGDRLSRYCKIGELVFEHCAKQVHLGIEKVVESSRPNVGDIGDVLLRFTSDCTKFTNQ